MLMSAFSSSELVDSIPTALLFFSYFIVFCTTSKVGGLVLMLMFSATGVGSAEDSGLVYYKTSLKFSTQLFSLFFLCSQSFITLCI
jgi:hypothetical protein